MLRESIEQTCLCGLMLIVALLGSLPELSADENDGATSAVHSAQLLHDVPYKVDSVSCYERSQCKLDLYLPTDRRQFSTIVWFHGGGIQESEDSSSGKRDATARKVGGEFQKHGFAVASVEYRLSPRIKFPAYLEDAAAAVSYIHRTIERHGGDPGSLFVAGHSAGGYLAAMLCSDEQYLTRFGLRPSSVAGCIPISGQMITHSTVRKERGIHRTQPIIDEAAPSWHVKADLSPFLNIVGGRDLPARAEENRYFIAALKAAGHVDAEYVEVGDRDHGTIVSRIDQPDDEVVKVITCFIHRIERQRSQQK